MADIQSRLRKLELPFSPDELGTFADGTRAAVEAFQHRRGLRVDGVVGPQTWAALVEAGFHLGDRFIYLRSPMMRGDDVADVQRRLSALGFDSGRVDGIFGRQTSTALAEFQRNTGLPVDAIVGAATLRELIRVTPRHGTLELVTTVRDRERMRHGPRTLLGRRVAVAEEGGLDTVVAALRRRLGAEGAVVIPVVHPDGSAQADRANTAEVEVFVGLRLDPEHARCQAAYYSGYRYESAGGRRLAELAHALVAPALGVPSEGARGMAVPVLRETRMPAVLLEVGPAVGVAERAPALASALVEALAAWVATPIE